MKFLFDFNSYFNDILYNVIMEYLIGHSKKKKLIIIYINC